MEWLGRWDVALLLLAAYVAVMTLVRMMIRRRDQLVSDVRHQLEDRKKVKKPGPAKDRDAA